MADVSRETFIEKALRERDRAQRRQAAFETNLPPSPTGQELTQGPVTGTNRVSDWMSGALEGAGAPKQLSRQYGDNAGWITENLLGGGAAESVAKGDFKEAGSELVGGPLAHAGMALPKLAGRDVLSDLIGRAEPNISNIKLSRPLDQMTRGLDEGAPLLPRRDIEWDKDLKIGDAIVPLLGDRTQRGKTLTHVNDEALPRGVPLEGGSDYMRSAGAEGDRPVWASEQGRISTLDKRVKEAGNASTSGRVLGSYMAMGPKGGDFSRMQAQPVHDLLVERFKGLDPKLAAKLDLTMASRPNSKWPGLDALGDSDWLDKAPGVERALLSKSLDKAPYRNAGFPDIGAIRASITEPDLLYAPHLSSGRNISELTPGSQRPGSHGTYGTDYLGNYTGSSEGMPWDVMFRDFGKTRPAGEASPNTQRAIETMPVRQMVDQQLIDALMERQARLRMER